MEPEIDPFEAPAHHAEATEYMLANVGMSYEKAVAHVQARQPKKSLTEFGHGEKPAWYDRACELMLANGCSFEEAKALVTRKPSRIDERAVARYMARHPGVSREAALLVIPRLRS